MSTTVLNVKIESELKDALRQYAEARSQTLSVSVEALLRHALDGAAGDVVATGDIDSQHTEEDTAPLTAKELKAVRKLLKKKR
ncbi:hypothetical protein RJ492_001519 [Pluralibacter gergoviae]|uniref:CopG family transcriptional regulator n=1 Tax=Pluralibacter gergoviae TaxID=61647 RepID=A0A089PWH2_PLUGE|nr:hypothetical protein [Pluralibacter gergoviae]AIR02584.1 hypothetical protein LG71_23005 [Pluralibacter gergoviae]AVR03141.1 hypothetical protein A8H26_10770 [Pluralibacter gergoviae]EKT9641356.1 hypothetical protein [Pluralibacter gergoviae]EKV0917319.1 hypothetical protein [Pluralibacter gergoviae]EKV0930044.1 hypothetical protein [Pluralibacter gergoviae]